ncbi:MAG: carbohydrate binding domain-containing protein [Treponema sp.]|nr:carbohydrate binding domain-containing protein [Treponema sp.]
MKKIVERLFVFFCFFILGCNSVQENIKEDASSYPEYKLVWQEEFNGKTLNRNDWNVELHDPGWVNAEWQEYVDSEKNIFLKDGKLVIKPIKTVKNGKTTYTSGRINTQNKHTFKYGRFEARLRVPEGKGYLPAFWLMPNDEHLYGQWPRCGEIDIMEVHGSETGTLHGTIHYGNPHKQSQGKHLINEGSFSEDFHTFAVEWEPGIIKWYVDDELYHTENQWYSITEGVGEITYPAPFDQPFYIILNLAVGGSWVGYPDETTDFENATFEVDYVRVYQKNNYDENVAKPEITLNLREPDAKGNYIKNGDFSETESLTDTENWSFLTAQGGKAQATIQNNSILITTEKSGIADYSVQLVQPNLPIEQGATYKLKFDAVAKQPRTMIVDISAPNNNWIRYLNDTKINLTTNTQSFTFDFTMKDKSDENGRLEFNLGNTDSIADVSISNISLIKTDFKKIEEEKNPTKKILADGNHIYNGSFQEGENRLGFWEIKNNSNAKISVTNTDNIRRLKIEAQKNTSDENPIIIQQTKLATSYDTNYSISFDAEGPKNKKIVIEIANEKRIFELSGGKESFRTTITPKQNTSKDFILKITEPGIFYIDNIRLVDGLLIKNGNFSAGLTNFNIFVDSSISAQVTAGVDSLKEDNAIIYEIQNTGNEGWKIQLTQTNVELQQGKWYRLSFDAKSSMNRKIMYAMQRNGNIHNNDWTVYFSEKIVDVTNQYQRFSTDFQMTHNTDLEAMLSISMGAVNGQIITQKHSVTLDNIYLEEIDPPITKNTGNLLNNPNFQNGLSGWINAITEPGKAISTFDNNKAIYKIEKLGTEDWNIQLKQEGITLEKDAAYKLRFKAKSTETRNIRIAILSPSYDWYGGSDVMLSKDKETDVEITFTMNKQTDTNSTLVVSMGIIDSQTPLSTITLYDFILTKQ